MGQQGLVDDILRRTIGIQPNGSIRNAANFHIRPGVRVVISLAELGGWFHNISGIEIVRIETCRFDISGGLCHRRLLPV